MGKNIFKKHSPAAEANRQLIVSLLPRFRRFARSLSRDADKADDLVQAACERALGRLSQFREGSRLDSWIYRIIYTCWIDKKRRDKTRTANLVVLRNDDSFQSVTDNSGARLTRSLDIKQALQSLSEDHRAAILLVVVEGFSYTEASSVLNVPVGTVASRVARARTLLGKRLSRRSYEGLPPSRHVKGET